MKQLSTIAPGYSHCSYSGEASELLKQKNVYNSKKDLKLSQTDIDCPKLALTQYLVISHYNIFKFLVVPPFKAVICDWSPLFSSEKQLTPQKILRSPQVRNNDRSLTSSNKLQSYLGIFQKN